MSPIPISLQPMLILLALCVIAIPLVMWLGRTSFAQAGWRKPGWRGVMCGLAWGGLTAVAALAWLNFLLHTGNYLPLPIPAPRWTDWLLLVIAVPLIEEPLFRGALFGGLQRTWQPFWAFTLSATAYVACHPNEPWLAFLFVAGLAYAAAFSQGRSLLSPILAHAMTAAVLLLGRLFPAVVQAIPWLSFAVAGGALIFLVTLCSLLPEQ